MAYDSRCKLWFGTETHATWVRTPLSGAEGGSTGWESGGTLLSGGGFQFGSQGSHREYTFEWAGSSTYDAAQEMLDFANGTYGRGLIHFVLPTIYDKNILPAQWAVPAGSTEVAALVNGVTPTINNEAGPTLDGTKYPRISATWDLTDVPVGRRPGEHVFIPMPEGYDLVFGFVGSTTGTGGVFVNPVSQYGLVGEPERLTPLLNVPALAARPASQWPVVYQRLTQNGSRRGAYLWVGNNSPSVPGAVTIQALTARLIPSTATIGTGAEPFEDLAPIQQKAWTGGMGSSGARFVGKPTMDLNTGIRGGTAGFATTLREVGTWLNR